MKFAFALMMLAFSVSAQAGYYDYRMQCSLKTPKVDHRAPTMLTISLKPSTNEAEFDYWGQYSMGVTKATFKETKTEMAFTSDQGLKIATLRRVDAQGAPWTSPVYFKPMKLWLDAECYFVNH